MGASPKADRTSTVETITEQIAFDIASGRYAPGERLPSVRGLAAERDINPSTAQIVLGRLASSGFVDVQPNGRFVARDIDRYGGIETWRYVFRFAQRLPERSCRLLEDLLSLRLLLIEAMLEALSADPARFDAAPVRQVVEQLTQRIAAEPDDRANIARIEFHAFRALSLALRMPAVTAVLNSIGEIYLSEGDVIAAMYADVASRPLLWGAVLSQWERGQLNEALVAEILERIGRFDGDVVARYRARLDAR